MKKLKRDAARWRFTQDHRYVEVRSDSGTYAVGLQAPGQSVNHAILAEHRKLGKAIDQAIEKAIELGLM